MQQQRITLWPSVSICEHTPRSNAFITRPGITLNTRAQELFRAFGGLFSFELVSEVDLWDFLNRLNVIVKSSNLGDNRTLAIPVAHTIYFEMGAERRASMGIDESLIRISSVIEDCEDLLADLAAALG